MQEGALQDPGGAREAGEIHRRAHGGWRVVFDLTGNGQNATERRVTHRFCHRSLQPLSCRHFTALEMAVALGVLRLSVGLGEAR